MNLVTLLVIVVVLWFVYRLMESYKSIERELREIRLKISMPEDTGRINPITSMKTSVVESLSQLKGAI